MKHALRDIEALHKLLDAQHPCIRITTFEEEYVLSLLEKAAFSFNRAAWAWSAVRGLYVLDSGGGQFIAQTENPAAALYHIAKNFTAPLVCAMLDISQYLNESRSMRALRETVMAMRETGGTIVLLDHEDRWPDIVNTFSTRLEISLPGADELEDIVRESVKRVNKKRKVEINLTRGNLEAVVRNLRGLTRRQAQQIVIDVVMQDYRFDVEDISAILAHKRRQLHVDGLLEYIEAPVTLDAVGGLEKLKYWLKVRKNSFSDKAKAFGLPSPRGVLLLGVQGAGKSLSAKAFATAWQLPLLRLDAGSLYDRYIGESERRLRMSLKQAEIMSPVVLWIDEIEKGFASSTSHSNDGGLSQRMFGTLLTWMQEHKEPVFLVATANDIGALPPELLRKGRFDEIVFVDLPDRAARKQIFQIHLAQRSREVNQFDLNALAECCDGYSGAEIEQAIVAAMHEAFSKEKDVSTEMIQIALRNSPPLSVTMAEHIQRLRDWSNGRCMPAN